MSLCHAGKITAKGIRANATFSILLLYFLTQSTHAEQHKLTIIDDLPNWVQYVLKRGRKELQRLQGISPHLKVSRSWCRAALHMRWAVTPVSPQRPAAQFVARGRASANPAKEKERG